MKQTTTVGVFPTQEQAMAAVTALRNAGFPAERLGLLSRASAEASVPGTSPTPQPGDPIGSHWMEGAGIGATTGGLTGAGFGLALVTGMIPALGPVVAGGVLAAILAPAVGGAAAGSLLGAILGMGIPREEAEDLNQQVDAGRVLVTVQGGDRIEEAEEILNQHGVLRHLHAAEQR